MKAARWLWLVCVLAALNGLFFIWYQRPDWATEWTDQVGYRRLGEVLAATGKFTRFPDAPRFVPEVIRTPLYPIFVAAIYRIAGVNQLAVALAQTGVFVLLCLTVYAIARRITTAGMAVAAAGLTALFPPFPYFGALVMTELWTTFLFTLAMWAALVGIQERRARDFALLGFLLGAATLSRPVFVLFPFALAAVGLILFPLFRVRSRPPAARWALAIGVFALTMAPWFGYNYANLGRFTLSPAGGVGRGLWEGSWQATWSGRLQNDLTHLAEVHQGPELDREVEALAAREHLSAAPMLEYVHQWRRIHELWDAPSDPFERAAARVLADQEYERVALQNLRHDSTGHLVRRLARGVFILWAGDIPFRYSAINSLPPIAIRVCWAIEALLCLLALYGLLALSRAGRIAEALLFFAPLLYLTAVHFPLLTEARQSLPAKPIVLLMATLAIAQWRFGSLALEPQVHEREHV
jgi:4-amino-4-deoxy-L-arabinose transferase-like glycosyltransferase